MYNVRDFCKNKDHIYIYGAGYYGRIAKSFLDENNILADGFLVTELKLQNTCAEVLEAPVYEVGKLDLVSKNNVGIIVAVAESSQASVLQTISSYGLTAYYCLDEDMIKNMVSNLCHMRQYRTNLNINVLIYHRVGDYGINSRGLSVQQSLFEKQLVYLKENYRVVRADEEWSNIKEKAIALTFDDGYYDFYSMVLPLLEKYEIPGTVFISTGNINSNKEFWGDELERLVCSNDLNQKQLDTYFVLRKQLKAMDHESRRRRLDELAATMGGDNKPRKTHRTMTSEEIRECSKSPFVTIGAHTVNHTCLSSESAEQQRYEMETSKRTLEEITGEKVDVFAYPYGECEDFSPTTIKIAREVGFKRVFAAYRGLANSFTEFGRIPRNDISKATSFNDSIRELKLIELCYADPYV